MSIFVKEMCLLLFKVSAPVLYSPLGDPDSGDPSSSCVNSHFQALGEGFVTIMHKYVQVYSGIAPVLGSQMTNNENTTQIQVYSGIALVLKVSFENSEIVHLLTLVLLQS